jgi:pimeloyl-ACP methyl ester carboxylesterase
MEGEMTEWFEGDVIAAARGANGIRLHYYRTGGWSGNGKPALLIATGVSDIGIGYSPVARELEGDYDVIMYDKRGHGRSEKPESGYTFEVHAADLVGLIQALGLERPRLMAHSGGAGAAVLAASEHPDLLAGLILYDPCWGSGWGNWEQVVLGMREWFTGITAMTRDEVRAGLREQNPTWTEQALAFHVQSKVLVSPHVVQTFDQPAPRWREALPKIACPILLLTGDPEKGLITPGDVQAMSGLWRDGRVVQIEGAGHMVHYDRPEPFIEAVQAFLADTTALL